jgi:TPP-dependent trihydroxycyclohexane-1,2-dione (THcHDO) dehydratase
MIMCGAGAQHAPREVELLAETLQAPVTAFRSGRGIVPEDHALGVAAVAARELWDDGRRAHRRRQPARDARTCVGAIRCATSASRLMDPN